MSDIDTIRQQVNTVYNEYQQMEYKLLHENLTFDERATLESQLESIRAKFNELNSLLRQLERELEDNNPNPRRKNK